MIDAPVSVVIPIYNRADLLAETLDCIGNQTFRPRETIVVDDGSTDDLDGVARRYPEAIFLHLRHSGAAVAKSEGARRATQPFLAFLDADDLWPETRTERMLAPLLARHDVQIVTGCVQQFRISPSGTREVLGQPMASRLPSVSLIRRDAFWRVGAFSSQWQVGETIEWCVRAVDAGLTIDAIPDVVLLRRVHAANLGKTAKDPGKAYLHMLRSVMERRRGKGTATQSDPKETGK